MKWLVLVVGLLSACDGPCVDGICPDFARSTKHPGPCTSADEGLGMRCTYDYDDAGRVTRIHCPWESTNPDFEPGTGLYEATWSYDATGEVDRITSWFDDVDPLGESYQEWSFTVDRVYQKFGDRPGTTQLLPAAEYDRATFAFLPMPGDDKLHPAAELGLIAKYPLEYEGTYSWTGIGTSTLVKTENRNGRKTTYELDERGRIVKKTRVTEPNENTSVPITEVATWTFDEDRLVHYHSVSDSPSGSEYETRYQYDRGGNLAAVTSLGGDEAYDYRCWE